MDCSPPGSSVHGILQARILKWVAISSSRDLAKPGIEPVSSVSSALVGGFFTTSATWKEKPEIQICFVKSFSSVLGLKDSLRKETSCYTHNEQFQYLREDYLT